MSPNGKYGTDGLNGKYGKNGRNGTIARNGEIDRLAFGGINQAGQIVPPRSNRRMREFRMTTKPKGLALTVVSSAWVFVCIGTWRFDYSERVRIGALVLQGLLMVISACLWRTERWREVGLKGDFPDPPVIHGV